MSQFDYQRSRELAAADYPFNLIKLKAAFPETWAELESGYNAAGGRLVLPEEDGDGTVHVPPAGG
jgi:hypothetical protein